MRSINEYERLKAWNKRLNDELPMSNFDNHPNPIIRLFEKNRRRLIVKHIGNASGKVFADVGCETGYISEKIEAHVKILVDIDIRRINSSGILIESDAQDIDLPDDIVDISLSAAILEHLPDPSKGFQELVRITKPGGRIVVSVPNERFVLFVKKLLKTFHLSYLLGKVSEGLAPGHLHIFNRQKLESITPRNVQQIYFGYDYPFCMSMFAVYKKNELRKT